MAMIMIADGTCWAPLPLDSLDDATEEIEGNFVRVDNVIYYICSENDTVFKIANRAFSKAVPWRLVAANEGIEYKGEQIKQRIPVFHAVRQCSLWCLCVRVCDVGID